MKVWQIILISLLLVIIFVLGFYYITVSNEFDNLKVENNKLVEEYNNLEKDSENSNISLENTQGNESDIFYKIIKNNALNYRIYDYSKTKEENIKNYIEAFATLGGKIGQDIPCFSNPNQLNEEALQQLFSNVIMNHSDANLYVSYPHIIIHKDAINNILNEVFGNAFDVNKLELEKISIYPFEDYKDIYTISASSEYSELQDVRYVIVDTKEKDDSIEVTLIEYCLCDEAFVLEKSEKSKRALINNQGKTIKEYNIEAVENVENYLEIEMTDNEKKITYNDIEKYVLDNKNKFEMKKITFKNAASKLNVVSCEIVK